MPARSQRRSSENWRTKALVPRVNRAAPVGIGAGDRRQIDDRALALDQLGQQRPGQRDQAGDVGLDHRFDRGPSRCPAAASIGGARPALLSSRSISPHGGVELREAFDRVRGRACRSRAAGTRRQAPRRARAADRRGGRCRSLASRRAAKRRAAACAEAGGRAGDEDRLGHAVPRSSCSRASVSAAGFTPICSDTDSKSGSWASRNRISARARRVVRPCRSVICPDSGQVQEPLGAPFVGERRGKCGQGRARGDRLASRGASLRSFRSS